MSQSVTYIFCIFPVVFAIIIAIFVFTLRKKNKKAFENAANKLGGSVSNFNEITGRYKEAEYILKYYPPQKNTPPSCRILIKGNIQSSISFLRENAVHKLAKYFKLSNELNINYQKFDDIVYINTRNNDFAKMFLSDSKKKD